MKDAVFLLVVIVMSFTLKVHSTVIQPHILLVAVSTFVTCQEPPMPLDLGRPHEVYTDMGGDEALYGPQPDINMPNSMMDKDGLILVDGDMRLSKDQYEALVLGRPTGISKRAAGVKNSTTKWHTWPNARVPFIFEAPGERDFSNYDKYMIGRAMTDWERYTCIKFPKKKPSEKTFVSFKKGAGGCSSALGMDLKGRSQILWLGAPGCRYKGLYLHEIGHAIGLIHEQQRPDRDQYITIDKSNVQKELRQWFDKYPANEVDMMGVPYEYSSIMHYGITAFTMNKKQTIHAKDKSKEKEIDKVYLKELAYTDVMMVNLMYKCAAHCPDQNKCGSEGHLDENCNCICKDGSSNCDKTKKEKPGKDCRNKWNDWKCYIFANQGECERNNWYMSNTCARACGVCGPKQPKPSPCKDVYPDNKCKTWLRRGDCITNKVWMSKNCPVTCNLCTDVNRPEENCENKYKFPKRCDDKALDGDCAWEPVGMWTNCRNSCGWCNKKLREVNPDQLHNKWDETPEECKDENTLCPRWAPLKNVGCVDNFSHMVKHCKKSCGKCNDGTCKNLFDDQQCGIKAANGECVSKPYWMNINCAWACRRGPCEGLDALPTTAGTTTVVPVTKAPPITTQEPEGPCEDKSARCTKLAKNIGYCRQAISWMGPNCKKSCGLC